MSISFSQGMNCCSDRAITFHGLLPSKMYLMEYILYHLAVFRNSFKGLGNKPPQKTTKYERINNSKHQIGEPYVELLNKDWRKQKKSALNKSKKTMVENVWEEIFGS